MFKRDSNGSMRSGRKFILDQDKFVESEYNPLLGESKSEEERSSPSTPRSAVQTIDHGTSKIPHPSTPPTPTPPPPPPLFNMENTMKMHVFMG